MLNKNGWALFGYLVFSDTDLCFWWEPVTLCFPAVLEEQLLKHLLAIGIEREIVELQ